MVHLEHRNFARGEDEMRTFFYVLSAVCLLVISPLEVRAGESSCLGDWACEHHKLHESGAVKELMERTNSNCCGGEHSGECRASKMMRVVEYNEKTRQSVMVVMVFLNKQWCPTQGVKIHSLERMPSDVQFMVCASRSVGKFCPNVWCLGGPMQM